MNRVLIVSARFYEDISGELEKGAVAELKKAKLSYDVLAVPGAFEIPAAIAMAVESGKYGGYVALGCVIRGETTHYDYVCSESARSLMDLSVLNKIPLGYGILTCENRKQAWARGCVAKGNKGGAAVAACVEMMKIRKSLIVKR